MAESITGTCNCGQHQFTIPRPTEMNLCHCLDCCKWAGAFHSAHLFVKTKDIDSKGPSPKTWKTKGEAGNVMERAWCDGCGAGLWIQPGGMPDLTCLKAGLFDRKDIPNPSHENWLKNLESWESPARGTKVTAQENF